MGDWKDKLKNSEIYKPGGTEMKKKCANAECGKEFIPKEDYHKICPECNRKRQEGLLETNKSMGGSLDRYLNAGYFDDKENMHRGLFKEDAIFAAGLLSKAGMSATSFRNFYNKLKAIESRYKSSTDKDFDKIKPDIYAFERDAAYYISRGVVPEVFRHILVKNVELSVQSVKHFKAFIEHLFSILAYLKDITSQNKGGSR